MRFLIRTVEALIYPVGFIWLALLIGTIVFYRRKQKGAALFCAILCVFVYVIGATPLPEFLMAQLEKPYINTTVANAAPADAVIVLGGYINASSHDSFGFSFTSATDRMITGVEMLRQRKARALILGGGPTRFEGERTSEGHRVANFLKTWKVGEGEVIGLDACMSTREEAERVKVLMEERKWTNLVLVTSAFHMTRAMATFQKVGIKTRPVACDFEAMPVMESDTTAFRLVPIIDHIRTLSLYLHEVIGWYYYSARGWI